MFDDILNLIFGYTAFANVRELAQGTRRSEYVRPVFCYCTRCEYLTARDLCVWDLQNNRSWLHCSKCNLATLHSKYSWQERIENGWPSPPKIFLLAESTKPIRVDED